MADMFDIANLITTVGVEAVKIKQEPGVIEKTSNEILTELFSTFDAEDGVASPVEDDEDARQSSTDKSPSRKKKKSKKKHKHKDKRHKKKGKHNSSASNSDAEDCGSKRKKKHKKKSKRKQDSRDDSEIDSDSPSAKRRKQNVAETQPFKIDIADLGKFDRSADANNDDGSDAKDSKTQTDLKENGDPECPKLPPLCKKLVEEDEDDGTLGLGVPRLLEKPKQQIHGKILIKDLKNSAVFSETVKKVEIEEKEEAARIEDGEITDSSSWNRTPTLSPTPPPCDAPAGTLTPGSKSYKKRHRTASPGGMIKTDLRLILKEKEKKKFGASRTSNSHDGKRNRDHRCVDSRHKSGRRSQSRDRKVSDGRSGRHRSRSGGRENRRRSSERRERDRSGDKRLGRSRERKKFGKDDGDRRRSRSEDKFRDKHGRPRSRSKERKERIEIDKKKLLEIARRNAINVIMKGALPLAQQDKAIAAIQAGGKSVDQLTDFCKSLSKSEAMGELSSISSEEENGGQTDKGFHHPFVLRDRPNPIIMNIKDAKQLPTKTFQEKTAESSTVLRLQFPVSSGQNHRKTESEWIPVVPKKIEAKKTFVPAVSKPTPQTFGIVPPVSYPVPMVPNPASVPVPIAGGIPLPVPPPVSVQPQIVPPVSHPPVFPEPPPAESVDIGSIVSQRLAAMRRLRENPHDVEALSEMYRAQNGMKNWAESKQMPGQFTGNTGVKVLSQAELHSGYQAWARKDQLVTAAPVSGGMGMALLQKMGWRPGEGLGKNKEGTLVPLQLEVKLDKRGLVSDQDTGQRPGKMQKSAAPVIKSLEGKHPVSILGEYCSKRKYAAPIYEMCFESGPDHKKNFLFKVRVNGIEYKPTVASPNKKQAKAEAAQICLQTLGLLAS